MRESFDIDSVFWRRSMSRGYSLDLRTRLVECVEAGASRHEAAERFEVSVSSAVRWMQRFVRFGSVAAKPSGGSTSPLEVHAAWLLELVAKHPDLTLDEIVAAMRREGIAGSRTAAWRFFARHQITVKKKSMHAAEQKRADVARARRRWMLEQGLFDPARLVFVDETATSTNMARPRGRCARGVRLIGHVPQAIGRPSRLWPTCVMMQWWRRWWWSRGR
jgi:transposase